MKQNGLLLVAAIAAAMLVGCTPETVEPLPPAEPGQPQLSTENTKPETLVGTQWLDHWDYWEHNLPYVGDMHVLVDYRMFFPDDSVIVCTSHSDGAENFIAFDGSEEGVYTYDATTGILVYGNADTMLTAVYNVGMNAFVLENGLVYYREF